MEMLKYIGREAIIRLILKVLLVIGSDIFYNKDSTYIIMALTATIIVDVVLLLSEYILLTFISGFIKTNTIFWIFRIICANILCLKQILEYGFSENTLVVFPKYLAYSLIPLVIAQFLNGWKMLSILRKGLGLQ